MGGCEVREVFSACVRRLLLNIKPPDGHSPTSRIIFV
jgi:hypothetical protein